MFADKKLQMTEKKKAQHADLIKKKPDAVYLKQMRAPLNTKSFYHGLSKHLLMFSEDLNKS